MVADTDAPFAAGVVADVTARVAELLRRMAGRSRPAGGVWPWTGQVVAPSRLSGAFRDGCTTRQHSGMITRMRRMTVSIAALLLAGALAACGHSGGAPAAGAPTAPTGASTVPATPTGGDAAGFCAVVKQQKALLQGTELSSLLAGGSPDAWRAYLTKVATMNQQLDDAAPADIKPSVDALLKATSDMRAALEAAGYDVKKIGASKLISLLNTPARKDASAKLTAYVSTNCGIDLSQP